MTLSRHNLQIFYVFGKTQIATFSNQIESAQYNAVLAITGTKCTSKKKLCEEPGPETLME